MSTMPSQLMSPRMHASATSPSVWNCPPARLTSPAWPIDTGTLLLTWLPLPSWPLPLLPQAAAVPSLLSARLWKPPAATNVAPLSPLTATGVVTSVQLTPSVQPLPSCPCPARPHARTVPSPRSARLWFLPAATAVAPVRPLTWRGVRLSLQVEPTVHPLPSWPSELKPQAHTVPSSFTARLCESPPARPITVLSRPAPAGPSTCTGTLLGFTVLLPSWPSP